MNIKAFLKRNYLIKNIYVNILTYKCKNIYKTNYTKRALLSYSTAPFIKKKKMYIHPNYVENHTIAEILHRYGYIVDVYNNTFSGKINYKKYDIIVGEGLPISNYFFYKEHYILTVYYATGSHPFYNNIQSYKSLFAFYKKYKYFIQSSSRLIDFKWGIGASLSDYLILLGNDNTKKTFEHYIEDKSKIFNLNPPYYKTNVISDFSRKDKNKFLWFGSFGLIHKDLNTIIEIFSKHNEYELHICGYISGEIEFINAINDILIKSKNIHIHGFLSIQSDDFKKLMEECSFVVLTSCSEGCATSVITVMGNGGLIPLISRQCGLDIINGTMLHETTQEQIEYMIKNANNAYSEDMIRKFSEENIKYIEKMFSIDLYKRNIGDIFNNIFSKNKQ
ncbi:MAG: glycosyltransferase [Bacteroidales bacterium]|jgi:hypothetical protein|nr:glycosyltransferase [Bacteroidales bacterium]